MNHNRNLWKELAEMGLTDDEEEWHELERRDAAHQEAACREQYHKDARDFIIWRKQNAPKKVLASKTIRPKPAST